MTFTPKLGSTHQSPIDYSQLDFLAAGQSGMVYAIDEERVLKEYYEEDDFETERDVLQHLGEHDNLVKCIGVVERGLILERGKVLRTINQQTNERISLPRKMNWITEAAKALHYMHSRGIVHADIGCQNMVIIAGRLKLIDFSGCGFQDKDATSTYEWCSCLQGARPSQQSDIFAYGCAVYEIITGHVPHHDLEEVPDRRDRVIQRYNSANFPCVKDLPLAELMKNCWAGQLKSTADIVAALENTWD